ncbi:VanZ family protein [Rossellomorea vietnamensis]|uniref:VanZ family protein n=2 Tax=Rossellomorea vietnamensis TaxID=218284 RepID=A0A6I6UAY0_9BACI|nr:VanZ family protein [Rossellomorea vietnamensis]
MTLFLKRIISALIILGYMILIWYQSSHFNPEIIYYTGLTLDPRIILFAGLLLESLHLIEFGILYVLIVLFQLSFGNLSRRKEITAIILSFLYSVTDEIHQLFVPFRTSSIGDLVKNVIGILLMWMLVRYINKRKNKFEQEEFLQK